ncbi:MAG: hypothetical protein GY832_25485 [Chloroflexi bacterium]|nr:hypothetical protein [Chloroflexota bacterium]
MNEQDVERQNPLVTKIIKGEPIHVGERELVPLVRVTTYARRQAVVGSRQLSGQGWGFVHMHPVAILERRNGRERRIPIQDTTTQWLSGLLLAAFIIPMLLLLAVRLVRK